MTAEFTVLDTAQAADRAVIDSLRADPNVDLIDRVDLQLDSLRRMVPTVDGDVLAEPTRWAYYPWRNAAVHILGPRGFRRLRLDRNRNMITSAEQDRLGRLRIGIVGLSVGHVIAHTLAAEGLCGYLRLADFDDLELSNLNRVPATVLDLGENKAVITARRIVELEPYLDVDVRSAGVDAGSVEDFLDGLDIVIDECDSLDVKAQLRRAARSMGLPVLMATSDCGLFDVERFDAEPERLILHGLLPESDLDVLATLSAREKVPHVLRIVDAAQGSARAAASMVEVGQSISTWPQLAGDVVLGAAAMAEAVRRLGLGEPLRSGRVRMDVTGALDQLANPTLATATSTLPHHELALTRPADHAIEAIVEAAARAPSGGNAQPWHIGAGHDFIDIRLATESSATVDIGYRSSAVAVGAAMFNARVAAAAHHILGQVDWSSDGAMPLRGVLHFADRDDPDLAALYTATLKRETNRRVGTGQPLDTATAEFLKAAATAEGATLRLLHTSDDISKFSCILAAADRIRYLTPQLHAEMRSEVRWPGDPNPDTGIEVQSLELDASESAALDILRRADVMNHLADWDAGAALGDPTRTRIRSSSAVGLVSVTGGSLLDYARGGSAAEAVWIAANHHGVSVHPSSPLFVHARTASERRTLSEPFATELGRLAEDFNELAQLPPDDVMVIVFRFSYAEPPSTRSRRRDGCSVARSVQIRSTRA